MAGARKHADGLVSAAIGNENQTILDESHPPPLLFSELNPSANTLNPR